MHPSTTIGPLGLPISYRIRDIIVSPAVVLAPMEGVTNLTFRRLLRELGGPGLTYTEFIPSEGLKPGNKIAQRAEFDPDEYPIAVQIFGRRPQGMAEAARIIEDMGATICDINMGCPSKRVCARSGGSALMKDPRLAAQIVAAVRKAISIPLTVKMRSGFDASRRNAPELAWMCQEEGAEGITIHWRTRADLYGGQRTLDKIAETVQRVSVPVIGNGDIIDIPSAVAMLESTGCDGVMLGRGAMRNPWSLLQIAQHLRGEDIVEITADERRRALLAFLARFHESFRHERAALGRFKHIAKHFTRDLPDGKDFRRRILRSNSIDEVIGHTEDFFGTWQPHTLMPLSVPPAPASTPAGPSQSAVRSSGHSRAVAG